MIFRRLGKILIGFLFLGLVFSPALEAHAYWDQNKNFFIESDYDLFGRNQIETKLIKTATNLYFYVDKVWFDNLPLVDKQMIDNKIYSLATDFEYKTYPILHNALGLEENPGIDNDSRIVIVLHQMKPSFGGYIKADDSISKNIFSRSNEGQIIYLNANNILNLDLLLLDYHLAHEFSHLITLNLKFNADIWFSELVSEWSNVILDFELDESILKQRAQQFLASTNIELVNWSNNEKDYGKARLLAQYLSEQYSNNIIKDALNYPSRDGIVSLEQSLKKNGFSESFQEVFMNFLIANALNDCNIESKYCYKSSVLKNFSIIPYKIYMPTIGESLFSITDSITSWSGKWQELVGGHDILKLKVIIPENTPISSLAYIIEDESGKKTLNFLDFTRDNIEELFVKDFGTKNISIILIPVLGKADENINYFYSWEATTVASNSQTEQQIIEKLTKQIEELKRQVVGLQLQLAMLKTNQGNSICSVFSDDLYYGMNSNQVKCLQQFLTNLGPSIYPEKLITGYFGPLTQAAVKRYQALKGIITTGYFGPITRAAVNHN
jgi:peptidoglycan hydrolase-like protein with peptidoglycan-binding domain